MEHRWIAYATPDELGLLRVMAACVLPHISRDTGREVLALYRLIEVALETRDTTTGH